MSLGSAPYLSPVLRAAAGNALRPGGLGLTQRALAQCAFSPGDPVLDLGCGPGESLRYLGDELGLWALGLDREPRMLAEARAAAPGAALIQAEAGAIPLADGSLAGVLAECVLSLADDPGCWLAECARVLAPGGLLMASDLYLREPPEPGEGGAAPGCLGGARGREGWLALLENACFVVSLWEDHSPLLRQLTARLVWEHGSAAAFWQAWCGGPDCRQAMARAALARPGYFLLLAVRKENPLG